MTRPPPVHISSDGRDVADREVVVGDNIDMFRATEGAERRDNEHKFSFSRCSDLGGS